MSDLSFATPALLLALPLIAAVALWRLLRAPSRPALAVADAGPWAVAAGAGRGWRLRLLGLPAALRLIAAGLIVVALARPQQGLALVTIPEEGIDIVVALDVSSSMGNVTGAGGPTRLDAARTVIEEFVGTLEGDRVGLVMFQSRALVLSPLTDDLDATISRVRSAGPGLIEDGTAIGLGLAESVDLVRESPARSRVVVLLTDGQNNSGEVTPVAAAQVAAALGVRVYTVGFVAFDGTSAVDEATLRRIAELTDASYYDARTQEELAAAYEAIGLLERSRVGERRFSSFREFGPWLAGGAAALLAVEALLASSWLRRQP
jgi:Ca-activated chloride channel family protein